jgi:MazG family protein
VTGQARVVLVETEPNLPGLLPFQAWDALGTADEVLLRDPDTHPAALHLHYAGLDLTRLEPATLDRRDLDLTRPGSPEDRRLAKALIQRAGDDGSCVYLLGPDDGQLPPAVGSAAQPSGVEVELVLLAQQPPGVELLRLVDVVRRLRDPETGCPWDLEQDHASLVRHLIEETYELVDAIEGDQSVDIVEELGDVLLQVVLHAQVASDRRAFDIDQVARGIADKLVHRHPHVFSDLEVVDADEVAANWETIKTEEKGRTGPFEGVPAALPGLVLLETLQRKAAKRGFDWDGPDAPLAKVAEELDEVRHAVAVSGAEHGGEEGDGEEGDGEEGDGEEDDDRVAAELGDLFGAVVGVARQLGVDADAAARGAARTFRRRFEAVLAEVAARDLDATDVDADTWRQLWDAVKARER